MLQLPTPVLGVLDWVYKGGKRSGKARLEIGVLSVFAWYWKLNQVQVARGRPREIDYGDTVVSLPDDEFVVSVLSVAKTLWLRLYEEPIPRKKLDDASFQAFYKRVQRAAERLTDTQVVGTLLLQNRGPARPDMNGKAQDAFGQRWTMTGSVVDTCLDQLASCGGRKVLLQDGLGPGQPEWLDAGHTFSSAALAASVRTETWVRPGPTMATGDGAFADEPGPKVKLAPEDISSLPTSGKPTNGKPEVQDLEVQDLASVQASGESLASGLLGVGFGFCSHSESPRPDTSYVDIGVHELPIVDAAATVDAAAKAVATVDVATAYDRLLVETGELDLSYREAAVKTGGLDRRERSTVDTLGWQQGHARQDGPSAFVSVGSFRRGAALARDRRSRTCTVPYVVFDLDGDDLDANLGYARALVERLVELGVEVESLVVSYSGNRSIHVRVPHGVLGRPVWPSSGVAMEVLAEWAKQVCGACRTPDGLLFEAVDTGLFSPVHLIRAIGGEHEKNRKHVCVGYSGSAFMELVSILGEMAGDAIEQHARVYSPCTVPSPDTPEVVPGLLDLLRGAAETVCRRTPTVLSTPKRDDQERGIIARIKRGLDVGEEFAPGCVGRNFGALLYADYLLTHGGLDLKGARRELRRWNQEMNPVPLGSAAGDRPDELEYVLLRARDYVEQQARRGMSWSSQEQSEEASHAE